MNASPLRLIKGFIQRFAGWPHLSAAASQRGLNGRKLHLCSASADVGTSALRACCQAAYTSLAAPQMSIAAANSCYSQRTYCTSGSAGAFRKSTQLRSVQGKGHPRLTTAQLQNLRTGASRGVSDSSASFSSSSSRSLSINYVPSCMLGSGRPSMSVQRRGFSSSTGIEGHGDDAIVGSSLLYRHPRLSPSVKICSACSASATPTEHSSAKGTVSKCTQYHDYAVPLRCAVGYTHQAPQ